MRKQRRFLLLIVGLSLGLSVLMGYINPQKVFGQIALPDEETLFARRRNEVNPDLRLFEVQPPNGRTLRPVERIRRDTFGDVGFNSITTLAQLDRLVYPSLPNSVKERELEGATFFTTPNIVENGFGSMAMQTRCAGCHLNNLESVPNEGLLTGTSTVSRANRTTPTNFSFVSGSTGVNGGGRAPGSDLDPVEPDGTADLSRRSVAVSTAELDAVNNTGRTAAFTVFGDFNASASPVIFDALNATSPSGQDFGGFLQHVRPPSDRLREVFGLDCRPDAIPSVAEDRNLAVNGDLTNFNKATGRSTTGFRRAITELAGPPYIGRGLIEAIPNVDITGASDPNDARGDNSSIKTTLFQCSGDCVTGVTNTIPANVPDGREDSLARGLGRFGLRANGSEMMQFIVGGMFGSLSMTNRISPFEQNIANPAIAPYNRGCRNEVADPELPVSRPFSERNFIRSLAPPEFGRDLLAVLRAKDPSKNLPGNNPAARVQRGAKLFGIDLVAFSNRTIAGKMPRGGDGLDPNAINQSDRMVGCVNCHTPIQRTGQSPATGDPSLGPDAQGLIDALSYRWAPIFSDINIHRGPVIDVERYSPIPRDPFLVNRADAFGQSSGAAIFATYDLMRNFASDSFSNVRGTATGDRFRTPPLMGIGRVGPPFMHDARVFLSILNRDTTPAGTVTTNSEVTNEPLVVRNVDEALLAAIELHDLPAPDEPGKTSKLTGGGCPVPPNVGGKYYNKLGYDGVVNGTDPIVIDYGARPQDVICPPYNSALSNTNRSEAKEVMARFRSLTRDDQRAIIAFLRQL
ncbi:hypothetical protein ACX27_12385 [Nostoc piscinale CENA21]|uniref:Cytochrome c domain-containing protein n=1 Tax=Nostoc piscinale CENA21 TaxID=224013 RepID=A0A0M4T420_9NOSO|nr:di-heme oxidoredictase family protein [Nostoc piscinale]ALF53454.1 hypothetical protein ACX27_12385 [Nostoc piscinale CENA21]